MKNLRVFKLSLLILATAVIAHAQIPKPAETPSMAEIQKQIKAAQDMVNKSLTPQQKAEIQKGMNYAKEQVNKHGVKNAQGKDVTDSVLKAIKVPDPGQMLNNMSANLNANMAKLKGLQTANKQALAKGLPQPGAAAFSAVPDAQRAQILAYAQAMVTAAIPKMNLLNPMLKRSIDDVLKDSTITAQAQGMEMLATGAPLPVVQYMVAKGVLKQPSNPWAANALGVIMRADNRYKEAIQCFKYAYWINPCMLIKCNLAWAIAYYGDFITAKRYFHEVLNIVPHYNSAWEGLGMIAYQQGDTATLFQCLAAQLNVTDLGGPDDGPSDSFVSFCGGVKMDQDMANVGKSQDYSTPPPAGDDNEGGDEGNQDPPPTAGSEYPTFPSMGGIFAQNIEDLQNKLKGAASFRQSILDAKKKSQDNEKAAFNNLSKMDERPYTDDQGMKVTPFHYSKFVTEFHGVQAEFAGRVGYVMKQYYDNQQKLINSMAANGIAFYNDYITATKQCTGKDTMCEHNIICEFKQKSRALLGSELTGASTGFTTAFMQLKDQIDWYIDATSPIIKRMHKPDWNHYLNATRRDDINQAVLNIYDNWVVIQTVICSPELLSMMHAPTACISELRSINDAGASAQGPKPTETKLKKYETPPAPCDKMFNMDKNYTYANIHRDCDGTRVAVYPIVAHAGGSVDAGPLHGSAEAIARLGFVMQTINKTGQTRVGTTGNISAEVSLGVGVKDGDQLTQSNASAGAGASAKVDLNYDSTIVIGNDGSIVGRAKTASFDAAMESHADASISNPLGSVSAKTEWKAEAKGMIDVSTVAGSSNTYNINQASFSASQSSSSSTHLPGQ
ncbi:hypothetical protein [Mucilaginibacter sp.]|uniref:tetratricopeptide repeat protein n=1 Tax=Mucilaginibacter sp. TaxID=1882438 RepID=UPI003D0FE83A